MILSKIVYKTGLEMLLSKREGQDDEELLFTLLHRLRGGSVKGKVVISWLSRIKGRSLRWGFGRRTIGGR
jgi:hypothetical protein